MMAALSDADCRSVMIPAPIALPRHATLATALRTLVELRLLSVPIVDDDGRYLGMLNRSRLIAQALPKIATLDEGHLPPAAQLLDVGFLPDTVADVRRRFAAIVNEPVEKHCDRRMPVLRPETPLMNTLYFLYKSRNVLPVVDGTTGKRVGLVTTWQVLEVIGGTATLIGDPPNILIGSRVGLSLNDFLVNLAPVIVLFVLARTLDLELRFPDRGH